MLRECAPHIIPNFYHPNKSLEKAWEDPLIWWPNGQKKECTNAFEIVLHPCWHCKFTCMQVSLIISSGGLTIRISHPELVGEAQLLEIRLFDIQSVRQNLSVVCGLNLIKTKKIEWPIICNSIGVRATPESTGEWLTKLRVQPIRHRKYIQAATGQYTSCLDQKWHRKHLKLTSNTDIRLLCDWYMVLHNGLQ